MDKKAIIYTSYHHHNTVNLLKDATNEFEYDWYNLLRDKDVKIPLSNYKTIIFASGIYYGRMHKVMVNFLLNHKEELENKKVLAIITSGKGAKGYAKRVKSHFKNLNVSNIEVFSCLAFDTYGPLKLIGGVNKGRPNYDDVNNLKEFLDNHLLSD
jgi:flavorubredoxin